MHPFTDIICLVHNNLPVTKTFVQHLYKNTENFRLIFINNGSTDQAVIDYLNSSKEWDVINCDTNLGIIKGRNLGATFVNADYFLNIDNDQYVGKFWLEKLFNLMNAGNFDIVGKEAWRLAPVGIKNNSAVNIQGKIINDRSYFPVKHCQKFGEEFTYIGCGGMLIHKKVYDKIGLFDERFSPAYFEDPDFCLRAIQNGFTMGWSYDCPIIHLEHQTMNKKLSFDKNEQFLKSWNEFKNKWHPFNPPLHKTLIK